MPDETPADRHQGRADSGPAREPLRELTLGRSKPSPGPPENHQEPETTADDEEGDWNRLAARCRSKAGAARWAAERQRRTRERSEPTDEELLAYAAAHPTVRAAMRVFRGKILEAKKA